MDELERKYAHLPQVKLDLPETRRQQSRPSTVERQIPTGITPKTAEPTVSSRLPLVIALSVPVLSNLT